MSQEPMRFPRGGRLLLGLVLLFFVVPVVFAPLVLWTYWRLDPVQAFYLKPYVASAIEGTTKGATVTVRYATKTAPGRRPAPLLPGDAQRSSAPFRPLVLSQSAFAAGWRGISLSPVRRVYPPALESYLRQSVYNGESTAWLIGQPVLIICGVLILLTLLVRVLRPGRRVSRAHEKRHGRRTKGPELAGSRSRLVRRGEDGIRLQLQGKGLLPGGSFPIPRRLEASHILLMGDTGSGKSSAIRQILRQVEARSETAIVYDPAMDFVSEFYSPERGDLILNPLDERCPFWSIPDEVQQPEMATTMAAAFIQNKEFDKPFFTDAPRRVLAHMLRQKPQSADLLRWMSNPEEIARLVQGTPVAAMIDSNAREQRVGVLSTLNLIADSLELLPNQRPNRQAFSTAEWGQSRKRWVFLTSSAAYREKLLPLHSVWLDLFILRMMQPCADPKVKPVWFVLDELASLNKLPQLHTAVTENRKYGNPVVMGLQGRSQMEKRYGQDAEAMLSQPATKIFLKTSEPRAAKWVSETIGEIEVERLKESRSMKLLGSRKSYSMEIATKPLIMASEISGLAPLHGFIKLENQVVPVHFKVAGKREIRPAFVGRVQQSTRLAQEPIGKPVSNLVPTPLQTQDSATQLASKPFEAILVGPQTIDSPLDTGESVFSWDKTNDLE